MKTICTLGDIGEALDKDITLSSYAIALKESVLYGAVLYNPKYQIYKLQVGDSTMIRAMVPDYVVEQYNTAYNDALRIKAAD